MKKLTLLLAVLGITANANAQQKIKVTITNPANVVRLNEIVELDTKSIAKKLGTDKFIITDANENELANQMTNDGKTIFQASVASKGKSIYYVKAGTPQNYKKQTTGRLFTERGDEFGWENDRVAYRIYGHGGAVGYDLFNKSTDELMLDYWYASEQNKEMRSVSKQLHDRGYHDLADQVYNAYCYHIDHGKGMDCYTVGPTLGAGANALVNADGSLCMPKCYSKYEILDNGPLRFTVKLTYPEIEYNGNKVVETRIITLDAGSQFCKVSVSYEGLTGKVNIASGVVIHEQNPTAYVLSKDNGYLGYEDLGDASVYNKKYKDELARQMGKIYVGTIYADKLTEAKYQERKNGISTGHILAIAPYNTNYTYYFGTAWSKNPNWGVKSIAEWEALLSSTTEKIKKPLKVSNK